MGMPEFIQSSTVIHTHTELYFKPGCIQKGKMGMPVSESWKEPSLSTELYFIFTVLVSRGQYYYCHFHRNYAY